jgi:hypothetical protein
MFLEEVDGETSGRERSECFRTYHGVVDQEERNEH